MAKKIKGKQILDHTIVKSINGVTYSYQGLTSSNDSNVTLNIVSGQTHSFNVGWSGVLPLNRGGLSNSTFTASQILVVDPSASSVVSSGYEFNDVGTASTDIWSARHIIDNIVTLTMTGARSAGNVTNQYLRSGDGLAYNITPILMPYDGIIRYISVSTGANSTWTGEVRNNGVVISGATISVNNDIGIYSVFNIGVSVGDLLQLYCNGTNVNNPRMIVTIVKR